jgi:hypothetical protein
MSGAKRIMVDEREWQRLQHCATKLRQVQHNLPELLAGVRAQTERELAGAIGVVEARQRNFDTAITAMGEHVRAVERESNRRLHDQAARMRVLVETTADDVRRDSRERIAVASTELKALLKVEQERRESAIAEVRAEVGALSADRDKAVEVARQWLADTTTMFAFIRDNLPHEQFTPGALAAADQRVRVARHNLDAGFAQAAIAGMQECFRELSELRITVELSEREWRLLHSAATESVTILLALVDDNRMLKSVDESGAFVDADLDVDFWTHGKLSRLHEEAGRLVARLSDESHPLTTEQLRQIVEHEAGDLERRLADTAQEAGAAELASQVRVNIADLVVQTLVGNGYQLNDGTNDQRAAFVARADHPDGSVVVVAVCPVPGDPPGSQVWIESVDAAPGAESSRVERAAELVIRLRESGLHISDPQEVVGAEPGRAIDIDEVRRRLPGAVLAPAIITTAPPPGRSG